MADLLEIGSKAPGFSLASHDDGKVGLADFKGKKNVLIVFYCKDDTPG